MLPLCRDQGVGVIPWSPLARGRLTRRWDETTERSALDSPQAQRYADLRLREIVEAVAAVAEQRGISRAQVALAWLLSRPGVTAPIVGATKPHHLDDAVAALDVELSEDEIGALEAPYRPREITAGL